MKQFDPIEYAQQLRGAGVSQEQADIQAQAFERVINDVSNNRDLVTQNDLIMTKNELLVATKELELKLIKWLLGTVLGTGFAILIAIAGLLKYMR
jgi:hypothetical protein